MANEQNLQLIVCGDLHDSKANLRGECVKAMLDTLELAKIKPIVIVSNHDLINERSKDHSLEFLRNIVTLITAPTKISPYGIFLPYYSDPAQLRATLSSLPKGSTIIMHQGIKGSNSGEYIQDHSAITHDDVKDFRVISGHYHQRQDIKCGRPRKGAVGLASYIGNPYTLNFGEANDPEKGFQVLMDDGTLEFVPTNLRKHIVFELDAKAPALQSCALGAYTRDPRDLVWVKARGTKEELAKVTKEHIKAYSLIEQDFRLTLEPTDETSDTPVDETLSDGALLDQLIDNSTNVSADSKERLKSKWKTLLGDSCASSQPQPKTSVAIKPSSSTLKTKA